MRSIDFPKGEFFVFVFELPKGWSVAKTKVKFSHDRWIRVIQSCEPYFYVGC